MTFKRCHSVHIEQNVTVKQNGTKDCTLEPIVEAAEQELSLFRKADCRFNSLDFFKLSKIRQT